MAVLALAIMIVLAISATATARLAPPGDQYDRRAMIAEANYALNGPYYGPAWIGQWNYMESDIAAQRILTNTFRSYAGWTTTIVNGKVPNGYIDGKGRGGQCLFFVNLLLYRSDSDRSFKHINWNYIEPRNAPIDRAKYGDIVFKPRPGQHIAVVYYRSGNYIVLVESNYRQPEIMAIRCTTVSSLKDRGYKVYTDVDYYYT